MYCRSKYEKHSLCSLLSTQKTYVTIKANEDGQLMFYNVSKLPAFNECGQSNNDTAAGIAATKPIVVADIHDEAPKFQTIVHYPHNR